MAESTPSIDVMMPYYGDVPLMQAAVRSVLAQTDQDWHLTVVDDGTEPGVPEWFAELADPRITYLRNEANLGISANFQKCLELAKRDRLTIMGCDDLLLPNYVAAVRELAASRPRAWWIRSSGGGTRRRSCCTAPGRSCSRARSWR
jgi:GT2 family glycosyltransferase